MDAYVSSFEKVPIIKILSANMRAFSCVYFEQSMGRRSVKKE